MPKRKSEQYRKLKKKFRRLEARLEKLDSSSSESGSSSFDSEFSEEERHSRSPLVEPQHQNIPPVDDMEEAFGVDPSKLQVEGKSLPQPLVSRWTNYLKEGFNKDQEKELLERWNFATNCPHLKAPQLNPEIQAGLSDRTQKQDLFISKLQDQLGLGLSIMGEAFSKIVDMEFLEKKELISVLSDAAKIFTRVHYRLSGHRRMGILPTVDFKLQKLLTTSEIDIQLFGNDLSQRIKQLQEADKIKAGLRNSSDPKSYLNSRRSNYKHKMKQNTKQNLDKKKERGQDRSGRRPYQHRSHQQYQPRI